MSDISPSLERMGNRVNSRRKPDTDMLKDRKNPTKRWYGKKLEESKSSPIW